MRGYHIILYEQCQSVRSCQGQPANCGQLFFWKIRHERYEDELLDQDLLEEEE